MCGLLAHLRLVLRYWFCLLLWIGLCLGPLGAQGLPPVRTFTARELGGERQVWDIAQAPDGTLALATQAGLSLFDGLRWQTLPVPRGHTLRTVIYRPADSSWLAGGYDGWWRWSWTGNFGVAAANRPTRVEPPGELKEEWWHAFKVPGDEDAVWWQSFSRVMREPRGGPVEAVEIPGNVLFARSVRDTLYLPVLNQGIYRREAERWQMVPGSEAFASQEIVGIESDPAGQGLLVATKSGSITRLIAGRTAPWPLLVKAAWGATVNQFLRLRDGRYALATAGAGLYLLDRSGRQVNQLRAGRGLPDDAVLSLFEDREGGLWVGLERGLAYLPALPGVTVLARELGPIYDLWADPSGKGNLLATNRGLFRLDSLDVARPVSGFGGQIWHISPTAAGLIVGTNEGTFQLDETLRPSLISTQNGGWSWLALDSSTALAGTYVGLERYVVQDGRWLSTGRIAGWDRPCRQVMRRPGRSDSYVLVDPQEGLWGFALDANHSTLGKLEQIDSVPGWLIEDATGLHYRCSDHGLGFDASGEPRQIDEAWTFQLESQPLDAGQAAAYVLRPGPDFIDVVRNATARFRLPLQPNLDYPLLQETGASMLVIGLDRGFARIDAPALPLLASRPVASAALVQVGNGVEIQLAQRSYAYAPQFRARLEGVDTAFSAWQADGAFVYAALRTGDYRLEWEGDDGQKGEVRWTVPPPWYLSPLAYLVYGLGIAGGFWALRIYYRRRLRTQQRRADINRERQLRAERLRARASRLEDEVRVSQLQVALSQRELALRQNEVEQRNRELADATLATARHNEALLQLRESIGELPKQGEVGRVRRQLAHILETSLDANEDWVRFAEHFDAVHVGFLQRLHDSNVELTPGDLRLAALLRMNLPSKEIAPLLHLSLRGVENKRYRLRKKLGLSADANLANWILSF